jgi:hypothetical protein
MKITLRSACLALLTTATLGGAITAPLGAEAQRGRTTNRYGNTRMSMESIRRLVDRAEDTSNEFREVFERYERDRDAYDDRNYGDDRYRNDRDWRNDRYRDDRYRDDRYRDDRYRDDRYRDDRTRRDDRYYRQDRYDRNDRYNNRDFSNLKQYVQRMDEGLERLNGETDDADGYSRSRATLSEILRNARIVNRSIGQTRGSSEMTRLWSRLRADLNALANAYGMQRI